MPQRRTNRGQTHIAAVAASLIALGNGTARNRTHAAEIGGTTHSSITPKRLAEMAARHPALSPLIRTNPLEITAEVAGEGGSKRRVSMREALSEGAERCVALMAELAPLIGKLTKEQERSYFQAARWLQTCRLLGLFGENEGAALPSELRHDPPPRTDTPEHWTKPEQMQRITARMITVIPEPEGENLDGEDLEPGAQR